MSGVLADRLARAAESSGSSPELDGLWRRGRAARRRHRAAVGAGALVLVLALVAGGLVLATSGDDEGVVAGPGEGSAPPREPTDLPVRMTVRGGPLVEGRPTVASGGSFAVSYQGAERWIRGTYADWEAWDGEGWSRTHELSQDGPPQAVEPGSPVFHTLAGRMGPGPDPYVAPEAEPGWYRVCADMSEERTDDGSSGSSDAPPGASSTSTTSSPAGADGGGPPSVGSVVDPSAGGPAREIRPCAQLRVPDPDIDPDVDPMPSTTAASPEPGEAATWTVDPADVGPLAEGATRFTALVSRVGCNGGRTGRVLVPEVEPTEGEVVITFTVERPPGSGVATCPGNDSVPYQLDLGQPVGRRVMVDGRCRAQAQPASACTDEAEVRWRPPG